MKKVKKRSIIQYIVLMIILFTTVSYGNMILDVKPQVIESPTDQEIIEMYSKRNNKNSVCQTRNYTPTFYNSNVNNNGSYDMFKIIGSTDERTAVSVINRYRFPYTSIGYLDIEWENKESSRGTGVLIGDNIVLTAGHNIYDIVNNEPALSVVFYPGRWSNMGTGMQPYGFANGINYYYQEFRDNVDLSTETIDAAGYDWGIIVLDRNIGNDVGYMGVNYYSDYLELRNKNVRITGYPKNINNNTSITMFNQYESTGNIAGVTDEAISYTIDTSGGQSGSPVYELNNYIVGVHNFSGNTVNYGKRVDDLVYYWCDFIIRNY